MAKEITKNLQDTIKALNAKYGTGTVISSDNKSDFVESVSTGSLTLDIATGIGGLACGKLVEMYGPESSGKSTLTLHIISEFQKVGKKCALIDSEHSFDKKYATALGVKPIDLIISQPPCLEDAYNIIQALVESGEISLIVFDSHTSSLPKAQIDNEVGSASIAMAARINSTALGKIHPLLDKFNCTLLACSQTRVNIGGYVANDIPTGGHAWKFYPDMRLKVSKSLDKEQELNKTTVEVIKNKCAPPFGKASFNICWGIGIDRLKEVIDLSVEFGILKKGGAWITLEDGESKIQGDEKMKEYLKDNPEYTQDLEKRLIELIKAQ